MKLKIIILIAAIIAIIALALFGTSIKQTAIKGISNNLPEYNCENNLCTSCIIEGKSCSCKEQTCECGNKIINKKECSLYR